MGQLEQHIYPYWGSTILTLAINFFGALMDLMIPSLMETMIDEKGPCQRSYPKFSL